MKQRGRPYLRAYLVLMVPLVALGIVYCCFVFAPTGYEDFAARHDAAARRASDLVHGQRPEAWDAVVSPPSGSLHSDGDKRSSLSPPQGVARKRLPLYKLAAEIDDIAARRLLDARVNVDQIFPEFLAFEIEYFEPTAFQDGGGAVPPDPTRKTVDGLHDRVRSSAAWGDATWRVAAPTSRTRTVLAAALDRTEELLLETDWEMPDDPRIAMPLPQLDRLAQWACCRAAFRGDGARAALLLKRHLEILKAAHFARFPDLLGERPWDRLAPAVALFLIFEDLEVFPEESLRELAGALENAHAGPADLEDLHVAHAMWARDAAKRSWRAGREITIEYTSNAVYDFARWTYGQGVGRFLAPLAARQTDWAAMAWIRGDPQEIFEAEKRLARTCGNMGSSGSFRPFYAYYDANRIDLWESLSRAMTENPVAWRAVHTPMAAAARGEFFNDDADMARFILAAVRYRRDMGAYPESAELLVPKYLPQAFVETPNPGTQGPPPSKWVLLFPEREKRLVLRNWKHDKAFREAWRAYESEHARRPETADDLRPYVQDEETLRSFACVTVDVAQRPVFCRFRPDVHHRVVLQRFIGHSAFEDFMRSVTGEGLKALDAALPIEAQIRWPNHVDTLEGVLRSFLDIPTAAPDTSSDGSGSRGGANGGGAPLSRERRNAETKKKTGRSTSLSYLQHPVLR